MLKLLEFDYRIEYKKGKENTVADALSRQFQDDDTTEKCQIALAILDCLPLSAAVPKWLTEVHDSYANDPHCIKLIQELTLDAASHSNYTLQDGVLRHKGKIYIGPSTSLRDKVFHTFHSPIFGGHSGVKVTLHKLQKAFYWPKLPHYIAEQVAACPVCQISKTEKVPYPGLLNPLPIPQQKWMDISMDFVEGLPKSMGKDVILVVVDRLTKYAHFIPLSHPYTVQSIADLFMANIIKLHGPLASIVSDRDVIFTSKLWKDIFSSFNIHLNYSTAHHPESDGQTERVNQCLEQYLRCMSFQQPKKWFASCRMVVQLFPSHCNQHVTLPSVV
jgi:hypothetical protein